MVSSFAVEFLGKLVECKERNAYKDIEPVLEALLSEDEPFQKQFLISSLE
jgi:hypothetical protein